MVVTIQGRRVIRRTSIRNAYDFRRHVNRTIIVLAQAGVSQEVIIAGGRKDNPFRRYLARGAARVSLHKNRSSPAGFGHVGRLNYLVRRRRPTFFRQRITRRKVGGNVRVL